MGLRRDRALRRDQGPDMEGIAIKAPSWDQGTEERLRRDLSEGTYQKGLIRRD